MSGNSEPKSGESPEGSLIVLAFIVIPILLFMWVQSGVIVKGNPETEFLAGFTVISDSDIPSLVGTTTAQLRRRLGKPDEVRTASRSESSLKNGSEDASKNGLETWVYYRKIKHRSSGALLRLECKIQADRCVAAEQQ